MCCSLLEFYYQSTFELTELVKSFFVQTESAQEGTPYTVFWYDSIKTDHSKGSVNERKKFHNIDYNDWTVQVKLFYI